MIIAGSPSCQQQPFNLQVEAVQQRCLHRICCVQRLEKTFFLAYEAVATEIANGPDLRSGLG
jgi:metal-dependent HD superfamily phosphatase/phosphodiesterase